MNITEIEVQGTKYQILAVDQLKSCGECQACCTVLGVEELKKPNYTRCDQLCKSGCSIYKDKPNSCTDYQCWYTTGLIKQRPDRIGLIVDFQLSPLPGSIRLWEVWDGAADTKKGKGLIKYLCNLYECDVWLATKKWTVNLKTGFVAETPSDVALPPDFDKDLKDLEMAFRTATIGTTGTLETDDCKSP